MLGQGTPSRLLALAGTFSFGKDMYLHKDSTTPSPSAAVVALLGGSAAGQLDA